MPLCVKVRLQTPSYICIGEILAHLEHAQERRQIQNLKLDRWRGGRLWLFGNGGSQVSAARKFDFVK
jgi:hypothetical protein